MWLYLFVRVGHSWERNISSQIQKPLLIILIKPTGYVIHQQVQHSTIVRSAHTVFMCFGFIWEQTVTCLTYIINWLVFIAEIKSVYCAVRTVPLNKAVCAWVIVKSHRTVEVCNCFLWNLRFPVNWGWKFVATGKTSLVINGVVCTYAIFGKCVL